MRFAPCPPAVEVSRARTLVYRFGWNTTVFQILNKGIDRWFSDDESALIGFVSRNKVRVVAGAPVCAAGQVKKVMAAWESQAADEGKRVCYFGAEGRVMAAVERDPRYCQVVLGAQPIWNPQTWASQVRSHPSFRAQLSRAKNKGVIVNEWTAEQAQGHPELWRILGEWLDTRGMPPLHFLVEPETLDDLEGRRIFVAERSGKPIGFLVLSPIPERKGYLTEQFVRGAHAPNGTVELLIDTGVEAIAASGSEYVTMGIVPLSSHGQVGGMCNPKWLDFLLSWVRAHGRRFYNFDGLDAFKSKFQPESWEAIYAISNERSFSFRTLYAIAAAFSDGPPAWAVLRAMAKAVRQEIRWLVSRISGRASA